MYQECPSKRGPTSGLHQRNSAPNNQPGAPQNECRGWGRRTAFSGNQESHLDTQYSQKELMASHNCVHKYSFLFSVYIFPQTFLPQSNCGGPMQYLWRGVGGGVVWKMKKKKLVEMPLHNRCPKCQHARKCHIGLTDYNRVDCISTKKFGNNDKMKVSFYWS